jgi:hypothetical protein
MTDSVDLSFPKTWEPFGWPTYAELQEVRQSWVLQALLSFGWTIHDVVDRRDVKRFLTAVWKAWLAAERSEMERREQAWREWTAWVTRMMRETPASARVA